MGLIERVIEYSGKDINSHIFKHSIAVNNPTVTLDNSQYHIKNFKRKVSESLFIKQNRRQLL